MKKILFILFSLLLVFSFNTVYASVTVDFDGTNPNIYLDSDVLNLNNYVHNDGDYVSSGGYAIESSDDLVIDLTGDNYIYGEGIYTDGNISFVGSGSLFIENLEVYGSELNVNSLDITIDNTAGAYYNVPYISKPGSVYYDNGVNKEYLRYELSSGQYLRFVDDSSTDKVTLTSNHELADVNNLCVVNPIYDNYSGVEYHNIDGLVYKDLDSTSNITYDSSSLTYKVEYEDGSINTNKILRMIFNEQELGKDITIKVLKANNILTRDGISSINEADTYSSTDYVGQEECYSPSVGVNAIAGGALFYFQNSSDDYFLKLEVIGKDGSHRYININYVEPTPTPPPIEHNDDTYTIPNTGIR